MKVLSMSISTHTYTFWTFFANIMMGHVQFTRRPRKHARDHLSPKPFPADLVPETSYKSIVLFRVMEEPIYGGPGACLRGLPVFS